MTKLKVSAKNIEGMLVKLMENLEKSEGTLAAEDYEEDIRKLLKIVEENGVKVSKKVLDAAEDKVK
ncbi:MAG: hypothetical protein CMH62_03585 [Nanoarchaeota archaeon]|nr:hypothetical protein [Nanoarchaeota archaeon]|tara:strand:+ start:115 stop:312 length:198 start_codon:yes stop_codon:yes gene_type:complete